MEYINRITDVCCFCGDDDCSIPREGCHIDDYITFEEMAAIVDYLREQNKTT